MQAVVDYGNGRYSWEVDAPISTKLGEMEPMFDAPESGPTIEQVAKWKELVESAEQHKADAREILLKHMAGFKHEGQIDNLELVSIDLHDRPDLEFDWSMAFELVDEGFLYTVLFTGDEPTTVTVDG